MALEIVQEETGFILIQMAPLNLIQYIITVVLIIIGTYFLSGWLKKWLMNRGIPPQV